MRGIFLTVLGMGITASMAIVVVLIFRLLLKGMPRIFSYILWLAVFWRLLCPFAPETGWGILPPVSLAEFYREDPSGLRKNVGETWEGTAGHPASHGEKRAGGDQAGKGVEGNVQEGNKAVRPLAGLAGCHIGQSLAACSQKQKGFGRGRRWPGCQAVFCWSYMVQAAIWSFGRN